ncbi:ribonuclease H-like domain-containing protein [Tanacetum coccineum]
MEYEVPNRWDDEIVDITDYKDSDQEDGELLDLLTFSATNEFSNVYEHVLAAWEWISRSIRPVLCCKVVADIQQFMPEGFDYDETFSLVVKMVTVRCLISIIVVNDWLLYQLDVNNAFLYGDLVKDFYMKLNQGYNSVDKTKVCKLNKSLYVLKQASRKWNVKLTTTLAEHGFK